MARLKPDHTNQAAGAETATMKGPPTSKIKIPDGCFSACRPSPDLEVYLRNVSKKAKKKYTKAGGQARKRAGKKLMSKKNVKSLGGSVQPSIQDWFQKIDEREDRAYRWKKQNPRPRGKKKKAMKSQASPDGVPKVDAEGHKKPGAVGCSAGATKEPTEQLTPSETSKTPTAKKTDSQLSHIVVAKKKSPPKPSASGTNGVQSTYKAVKHSAKHPRADQHQQKSARKVRYKKSSKRKRKRDLIESHDEEKQQAQAGTENLELEAKKAKHDANDAGIASGIPIMQSIEVPAETQRPPKAFGLYSPASSPVRTPSPTPSIFNKTPPPRADSDAYMNYCVATDRMPAQSPSSSQRSQSTLGNYPDPEGSELDCIPPSDEEEDDDVEDDEALLRPFMYQRYWEDFWRCGEHGWEVIRIDEKRARCGYTKEPCVIDFEDKARAAKYRAFCEDEGHLPAPGFEVQSEQMSVCSDHSSDDEASVRKFAPTEIIDFAAHRNIRSPSLKVFIPESEGDLSRVTTRDVENWLEESVTGSLHAKVGRNYDGHQRIWRRCLPVGGSMRYKNRPDEGRDLVVFDQVQRYEMKLARQGQSCDDGV